MTPEEILFYKDRRPKRIKTYFDAESPKEGEGEAASFGYSWKDTIVKVESVYGYYNSTFDGQYDYDFYRIYVKDATDEDDSEWTWTELIAIASPSEDYEG